MSSVSLPGESGSLAAWGNSGSSLLASAEPKAACQDLGLVFTTLLTAKSEDQLSRLLLAFKTFLETPRVLSFDRRNITAESSCFKDLNVPDSPPGTSHNSCRLGDTMCLTVDT